jgi:hypothetical protein
VAGGVGKYDWWEGGGIFFWYCICMWESIRMEVTTGIIIIVGGKM